MKFLKFAFVMTVMVIGLNSCQKDDEPKDEPKSVAGTWEGKFGYYTLPLDYYEKWELETGGELSVFDLDGNLGVVGSWDQDGNEIEVNYTITTSRITYNGTYDEDGEKITGTWHNENFILEGTFEMFRQ